jgi:hypothetical protein
MNENCGKVVVWLNLTGNGEIKLKEEERRMG